MVDNSYDYWCFPSACPRNRRWARYSTTPRRSHLCSSPPPVYHRVRSRSRVHWGSNQPRRGQLPHRCTIRVARSSQSRCIHRARFFWPTFDRSRRSRYCVASCYSALLDTTHETSSHVRLNREARSAITVIKLRTTRFSDAVICEEFDRTVRCYYTDRNQLTLAFLRRALRGEFTRSRKRAMSLWRLRVATKYHLDREFRHTFHGTYFIGNLVSRGKS